LYSVAGINPFKVQVTKTGTTPPPILCEQATPKSLGAPTGSPEAKSTLVGCPFGFTLPLMVALVAVTFMGESVVALGAAAYTSCILLAIERINNTVIAS
jgi:hypothetical protein